MIVSLLLSISLSWSAALPSEVDRAEALWLAGDYEQSNAVLRVHLGGHPEDPEALWRLARNLYDIGEQYAQEGRHEDRLALYKEVIGVAKQIQKVDPSHGQGPFWHGVALGRISTTKGILSQAASASRIEKLWLKALKSNTTYVAADGSSSFPAAVYYALGQYYRLLPDSFVVKLVTGVRGDIDKSIEYHRQALAFNDGWLQAHKELGVSLLCKAGRDQDALARADGAAHLTLASTMPVRDPTDAIDVTHIPIILDRWNDACGYSRDEWQEISEEDVQQEVVRRKRK